MIDNVDRIKRIHGPYDIENDGQDFYNKKINTSVAQLLNIKASMR